MQRGRGAGMSYRGGPTAREKANASDVELGLRENSAHLDALSDKVALLKGLTQEIEGEVAGQNCSWTPWAAASATRARRWTRRWRPSSA